MRYIALLGCVSILGLTLLLALKNADPKLYLKVALAVDVIGLSNNTQLEKNRLEKIDLLPISQEKKNILNNHTIFLGATPTMVRLALGNPMKEETVLVDGISLIRWQYHFKEDISPTTLDFEDSRLKSAYGTGSAYY